MKRLVTVANTLQLKVGNEHYFKMDAPVSNVCDACKTQIIHKKSYRKVNTPDFNCMFDEIGVNRLNTACYPCFNKFNKFKNFENDRKLKLEKMNNEHKDLQKSILTLAGVKRVTLDTPGKF